MTYPVRIESEELGVFREFNFEYQPSSKDIYDALKLETDEQGQPLVSPRKMLSLYDEENPTGMEDLVMDAYKNDFFQQESDVELLDILGDMAKSAGRGISKTFTNSTIGKNRLKDIGKSEGALRESYTSFKTGSGYKVESVVNPKYQFDTQEVSNDTMKKVKLASAKLLSLAQDTNRRYEDSEDFMVEALGSVGLHVQDKEIRQEVARRAYEYADTKGRATLYQSLAELVGGYELLTQVMKREFGSGDKYVADVDSSGGYPVTTYKKVDNEPDQIKAKINYLKAEQNAIDMMEGGAEDFARVFDDKKVETAIKQNILRPDADQALAGQFVFDPAGLLSVGVAGGVAKGVTQFQVGAIRKAQQAHANALRNSAKYKYYSSLYEKHGAKLGANGSKLRDQINKGILASEKEATELGNKLSKVNADLLKPGVVDDIASKTLTATGVTADFLGRTLEVIAKYPYETAVDMVMKASNVSEDVARNFVKASGAFTAGMIGFNEFKDGFTADDLKNLGIGATILMTPRILQSGGTALRHLGKHMVSNPGEISPSMMMQRMPLEDPALSKIIIDRSKGASFYNTYDAMKDVFYKGKDKSFMGLQNIGKGTQNVAKFVDKSGVGKVANFAGRQGKSLVAGSAVAGGFGYAIGGEEGMAGGIGASLPFLAMGMGAGELLRFSSMASLKVKQRGDVQRYRTEIKELGTEKELGLFDRLRYDDQVILSQMKIRYPDAIIELVDGDVRDTRGSHQITPDGQSYIEVNVNSPEPLAGAIAHEVGHHIKRYNLHKPIMDALFGDALSGKVGMYTRFHPMKDANGNILKDKSGKEIPNINDPVIIKDDNGVPYYDTNEEFAGRRAEYISKLKSSKGVRQNMITEYENNRELIGEEIFTDIQAKRILTGQSSKDIGYSLPELGLVGLWETISGTPFIKDMTTLFGGALHVDGGIFKDIKPSKQLNKIIRDFERKNARTHRGEIEDWYPINDDTTGEIVINPQDILKTPGVGQLFNNGGIMRTDAEGNIVTDMFGNPKFYSPKEADLIQSKMAMDLQDAIDSLPDVDQGHVVEAGVDRYGRKYYKGRFLNERVIDKLELSGRYNREQMRFLRMASQAGRRMQSGVPMDSIGNQYRMFYYSATGRGGKKYKTIRGKFRDTAVYGITITKDKNVIINAISLNDLNKNLNMLLNKKSRFQEISKAFGGQDKEQVKLNWANMYDKYLSNHMEGIVNGSEGSGITKEQANWLNAGFGAVNQHHVTLNPALEGLGMKRAESIATYRSFRIDRIGTMEQQGGGKHIDISRIANHMMPMPGAKLSPTQKYMPDTSDKTPLRVTDPFDQMKSNVIEMLNDMPEKFQPKQLVDKAKKTPGALQELREYGLVEDFGTFIKNKEGKSELKKNKQGEVILEPEAVGKLEIDFQRFNPDGSSKVPSYRKSMTKADVIDMIESNPIRMHISYRSNDRLRIPEDTRFYKSLNFSTLVLKRKPMTQEIFKKHVLDDVETRIYGGDVKVKMPSITKNDNAEYKRLHSIPDSDGRYKGQRETIYLQRDYDADPDLWVAYDIHSLQATDSSVPVGEFVYHPDMVTRSRSNYKDEVKQLYHSWKEQMRKHDMLDKFFQEVEAIAPIKQDYYAPYDAPKEHVLEFYARFQNPIKGIDDGLLTEVDYAEYKKISDKARNHPNDYLNEVGFYHYDGVQHNATENAYQNGVETHHMLETPIRPQHAGYVTKGDHKFYEEKVYIFDGGGKYTYRQGQDIRHNKDLFFDPSYHFQDAQHGFCHTRTTERQVRFLEEGTENPYQLEADSTKTRHVEELQSDLHQRGKKYGYKEHNRVLAPNDLSAELINPKPVPDGTYKVDGLTEYDAYLRDRKTGEDILHKSVYKDKSGQIYVYDWAIDDVVKFQDDFTRAGEAHFPHRKDGKGTFSDWMQSQASMEDLVVPGKGEDINKQRYPKYPYANSWPTLLVKSEIIDAKASGYDFVTFPDGYEQNARYNGYTQRIGRVEVLDGDYFHEETNTQLRNLRLYDYGAETRGTSVHHSSAHVNVVIDNQTGVILGQATADTPFEFAQTIETRRHDVNKIFLESVVGKKLDEIIPKGLAGDILKHKSNNPNFDTYNADGYIDSIQSRKNLALDGMEDPLYAGRDNKDPNIQSGRPFKTHEIAEALTIDIQHPALQNFYDKELPTIYKKISKAIGAPIRKGMMATADQLQGMHFTARRWNPRIIGLDLRNADLTKLKKFLPSSHQIPTKTLEGLPISKPPYRPAVKYQPKDNDVSYRGGHTAPERYEGASLDNLENIYPDDFYSPEGIRYYTSGDKSDVEAYRIVARLRDNPDAMVKVYRAVPPNVTKINPGDWVSITRDYAKMHGESNVPGYIILETEAKASDLFSEGNSIQEWGYQPNIKFMPSGRPDKQVLSLQRELFLKQGEDPTIPPALSTQEQIAYLQSRIKLMNFKMQQSKNQELPAWLHSKRTKDIENHELIVREIELLSRDRMQFRDPFETYMPVSDLIKDNILFDDWFEGSVIRDKDGNPLVVYHSSLAHFDAFRNGELVGAHIGNHFGTLQQASERLQGLPSKNFYNDKYAKKNMELADLERKIDDEINDLIGHSLSRKLNDSEQATLSELYTKREELRDRLMFASYPLDGNIGAYYLKIKNPLRVSDIGEFDKIDAVVDEVIANLGEYDRLSDKIKEVDDMVKHPQDFYHLSEQNKWKTLIEGMMDMGYDGLVYQNLFEGDGDSYVALDPRQIKSVHNKGTFDPNTDKVMYMPWVSPTKERNIKMWQGKEMIPDVPVKPITEISGESVLPLEADRLIGRGEFMGGISHPFLKSNAESVIEVDGAKFVPKWANMSVGFVTGAENRIANTSNGYAVIINMDTTAHKSNRLIMEKVMTQIHKLRNDMTPMQKKITAHMADIGASMMGDNNGRVLTPSQRKFKKLMGSAKSQYTRGKIDNYNKLLQKYVEQFQKEDWWNDKYVTKISKDFRKFGSGLTFNQRASVYDSIKGFDWLPDLDAYLHKTMDYRGGETDMAVGAVRLSQHKLGTDERIFAVYLGDNPNQASFMTENEKLALAELRKLPQFREQTSYDWVMLGEPGGDFLFDKQVDLDKLIPDYRQRHEDFKISEAQKMHRMAISTLQKGGDIEKSIKKFKDVNNAWRLISAVKDAPNRRLVVGAMKKNGHLEVRIPSE
jgi:hypothetical protein